MYLRRIALFACLWLLIAAVAVLLAQPQANRATAAFPGVNGKIAFSSNRDGNNEIYTMNPDGNDQVRLTSNTVSDYSPAWSPYGTRIAFVRAPCSIYVMNADGSGQQEVLNSDVPCPGAPAWSPDGSKIAFSGAVPSSNNNTHIYLMDADGTDVEVLVASPWREWGPEWSPDGSKIAFTRELQGLQTEVYLVNADGSNETLLVNSEYWDEQPSWSPDGSKIAFTSNRDGDWDIYVINADGSGLANVTNDFPNSPSTESSPAWSPDGNKIAFGKYLAGQGIFVMDADGGNAISLITPGSVSNDVSDWQPVVPVGGIAEAPAAARAPGQAHDASGAGPGVATAAGAAIAAGAVVVGGAAWYARRRRRTA